MMLRAAVLPVMATARVLQVLLWLMVVLLMPMVRVLPVAVSGAGLCVAQVCPLSWLLAGVGTGPRHSWQRAWRAAWLAPCVG